MGLGGMGGFGGMGGMGGMGGFGAPMGGQAGVNAGSGLGAGARPAGAGAGLGAGGFGPGLDLNQLLAGLGPQGQAGAGANLGGFMPPGQQVDMSLPAEERYKDQLQQMRDMGFVNTELNIQVLDQTGGNVQIAIERMLNLMG